MALLEYSEIDICGIGPLRLMPRFAYYRWEQDSANPALPLFIERARTARCIFDIGAHVGLYTLVAAKVAPLASRIIAFEPAPKNAQALHQHLRLNRFTNVDVVERVVVDPDSMHRGLYLTGHDLGDRHSLVEPCSTETEYSFTELPTCTIDSYTNLHNLKPDLIKIDVEGGELLVVEGALDSIQRYRPEIFLSIHRNLATAGSITPTTLASTLLNLNYEIRTHADLPGEICGPGEYVIRQR